MLLQASDMTLRLKTFFSIQALVNYLGHVMYPDNLAVASRTLNAISYMKPPVYCPTSRSFSVILMSISALPLVFQALPDILPQF